MNNETKKIRLKIFGINGAECFQAKQVRSGNKGKNL